jgi:hypothetical protein
MRPNILDHTALGELGRGNRLLSRLVTTALDQPAWRLQVPALCLAAAEAERPGLADHLGSLEALEIVDLDFVHATAVGRLVAEGIDWQLAHAVTTALPSPMWPDGCQVITTTPGPYTSRSVATVPIQRRQD